MAQLKLFRPKIENIKGTKFADGNGEDKKHYWLTPPGLYEGLDNEFEFDEKEGCDCLGKEGNY
jgi:hypothetical protein